MRDHEIDKYLERAAKWSRDTGMVADGIRMIEELIKENGELRKELAHLKRKRHIKHPQRHPTEALERPLLP